MLISQFFNFISFVDTIHVTVSPISKYALTNFLIKCSFHLNHTYQDFISSGTVHMKTDIIKYYDLTLHH